MPYLRMYMVDLTNSCFEGVKRSYWLLLRRSQDQGWERDRLVILSWERMSIDNNRESCVCLWARWCMWRVYLRTPRLWWNRYGKWAVNNFIKHREAHVITSVFERPPTEVAHHFRNTVVCRVIIWYPSGCPSLSLSNCIFSCKGSRPLIHIQLDDAQERCPVGHQT